MVKGLVAFRNFDFTSFYVNMTRVLKEKAEAIYAD